MSTENEEKQLAACRKNIDDIDFEIVTLLEARAVYAREIGMCKRAMKKPLVDRARESEVINRLTRKLSSFPESALRDIYHTIHAAMLNVQIGEERNLWSVDGTPNGGYYLMSGERILLAVGGDEPNRLMAMAELHNEQIKQERAK